MSDEETPQIAPEPNEPDLLVYDFLKYLTTLAILVLGGVLSLNTVGQGLPRNGLVLVMILVSMAGVVAVTGADAIVAARVKSRPLGWMARWSRGLALGLLGAGTGAFLSMWTQALK
ncbi:MULTISPECIES: hypothetical protein [Sphingomonas]|uniref:hypothetical protein n=1 Tax=Sphingomonas TaxID=13687 RepID=UPI0008369D86|nr:hypothetical protein [Sphingomonas sp. CCH10-B3]MBA3880048.1 hypothetical protein [Sphingobium sp.]